VGYLRLQIAIAAVAAAALAASLTLAPGALAARKGGHGRTTLTVAHGLTTQEAPVDDLVAVDRIPPSVFLRGPLEGAVYVLDQKVLADYECQDDPDGAGIFICDGNVASGEAVDTASVGTKRFTVHASDLALNTSSTTAVYQVIYNFGGFLAPVQDPPAVNEVRAGRTVPVKFSLNGFQGAGVLADGYPQVAQVECGAGEEPDHGEPAGAGGRPELVYRARSDRYRFLWRTERSWAGGCRQLILKLDDGLVRRAEFAFLP
jgi:hypothetical protein